MSALRSSLGWKLLISYLVVIVVGIVTLTLAAESVTPTAFNRHMAGMQKMMGSQMGMQTMADELYSNFRTAFAEALLWAAGLATASAVLVSVFVARRVVTPVRLMMQASRHIADGHYAERVPAASGDELGQLGRIGTN